MKISSKVCLIVPTIHGKCSNRVVQTSKVQEIIRNWKNSFPITQVFVPHHTKGNTPGKFYTVDEFLALLNSK